MSGRPRAPRLTIGSTTPHFQSIGGGVLCPPDQSDRKRLPGLKGGRDWAAPADTGSRAQNSEITLMLIKAKTLKGYTLESLDGEIGQAEEFYFDERHWTIRYLVASTGRWLMGRQVLMPWVPWSRASMESRSD